MKLYQVTVSVEVDLVILAESVAQARELGSEHWMTELTDGGPEVKVYAPMEITRKSQLKWIGEEDIDHLPPYGPVGANRYGNGNSSPQLSIGEYLEQMGIK